MGIGRDSFEGMYLMEDNLIFEMTATSTYVTNLYNYTLPLIRYQMSDHLQPITDTTHAMPFRKIKQIVGRKELVPIFINDLGEEDFISPHIIIEFYVKSLKHFQVYILDKKSFIFRACLEAGLSKQEQRQVLGKIDRGLKAILKEKRMTKVTFRIEVKNDLWVDEKTGKFKLIVRA